MKKYFFRTITCLVILSACQKQVETVEIQDLVPVETELTASCGSETKTTLTEFNEHCWLAADNISVNYTVADASRTSVFTSSNVIPSSTAKFTGKLLLPSEDTDLAGVSAIAVYPATDHNSFEGGSVVVTVPDEQTAVEGSFAPGLFPVVAKTDDITSGLSFKAVCGGVKVSFQTAGITSFTFRGKNNAAIAGKASVTFNEDGLPEATIIEGKSSITVKAPAGGFEVGKWYCLSSFPADLEGGYEMVLSNGQTISGNSTVSIKRAVLALLDSKDAPDNYSDLSSHLKPISYWDAEAEFISDAMPAYTATDREYDRTQAKNNISAVKFVTDASYIYGYIESRGDEDASRFAKLGLWIDVDGAGNGQQGGDWLFTLYKYFELSAYGAITGDDMVWSPTLRTQTPSNGAWYGAVKETPSRAAYGKGSFENSVYKFTFIIDRRIIGARNLTSAVIGINFDDGKGTGIGNFTNPDRGGFRVPLKNSDATTIDETTILKRLKSIDSWASIDYTPLTNKGNNRADTRLKFDSDADFIYGYIEIENTDRLYISDGDYYSFCPGFIKKLAVGFDLDGIETGQGIGWPIGNCWELVLDGTLISFTRPLSEEDKANGWIDRWSHYAILKTAFDENTTQFPAYTITPQSWNPIACSSTGGIGTPIESMSSWANLGAGKGEWGGKTFRYSFAIDRTRLGLRGLPEIKLGVFMYEQNIDGYSNTPDAVGTVLQLNN